MLSFWFIVLCGLVAVFAYLLAPDNSSNANQMHLEIHSKKPGFEVLMLTIPANQEINQSFIHKLLYGKKNQQTEIPISNYKVENETLLINTYTENNQESISKSYPFLKFQDNDISSYIKTKKFYLGTDKYGRDLLSRMLVGTRISFFIGFIAVFISKIFI